MHISSQQVVTHKLDPTQFAALMTFLTSVLESLNGETSAELNALTAKLKASADALESVVASQPQPQP